MEEYGSGPVWLKRHLWGGRRQDRLLPSLVFWICKEKGGEPGMGTEGRRHPPVPGHPPYPPHTHLSPSPPHAVTQPRQTAQHQPAQRSAARSLVPSSRAVPPCGSADGSSGSQWSRERR